MQDLYLAQSGQHQVRNKHEGNCREDTEQCILDLQPFQLLQGVAEFVQCRVHNASLPINYNKALSVWLMNFKLLFSETELHLRPTTFPLYKKAIYHTLTEMYRHEDLAAAAAPQGGPANGGCHSVAAAGINYLLVSLVLSISTVKTV